ncbi:MAG TPA: lipoprotein-releasing ABC transporter permease subunit [Rhodospirillaceae bacterium]|nr:lipoprotein-releasing system transmembrane subunit LolC [Candidatus Neomarinimicrobiota bacterium]HCX14042.1 lipoprotein-releasing ABC transporter permease subunit [Rhodospirillaceae bacterium]
MIFSAFEWMVALRYLRSRRSESFVSVIAGFSLLGIALGVATLIIVMAVMNGFRQDIMSRILGVNGHIDVAGLSYSIEDYDSKVERLKTIPGVVSVSPLVIDQVMATANGMSAGALVRGIPGLDLFEKNWISDHIVGGSLSPLITGEGIAIGSGMARRFDLEAGDQLTLISPDGNITAFGTVPRMRTFNVGAIFNVGMSNIDSSVVFMPLSMAQVYFKYPNSVSNIELEIANPDEAQDIARLVRGELGQGHRVLSWEETNSTFVTALQVERNMMFTILTIIIIVAVFNIISGLIMLVKDKGRDIAILRTIGATRGMIMRVFLIAGASVGVIGTTVGFALGILVCENIESIRRFVSRLTGTELFSPEIYFLTQMPAQMNWDETIAVLLMSLSLSFAATLYPSWRAARTDPVEALRYE